MFGNRDSRKYPKKNSFTTTVVNIATIVSTAVTCIRLAYHEIISVQLSALVMLSVVVFVALGNNVAKVVLAAAALFLFVLLYSYGESVAFSNLMTQMMILVLMLIGLYVMIRGFLKR